MTTASANGMHRYQRWGGKLDQGWWTWLIIVVTGIRMTLAEGRTRALLMTSMVIVLGTCIVLYVLSMLELLAGTQEGEAIVSFIRGFLQVDMGNVARIEDFRESLWRTLFLLMIKVEMFWVLLIVSKVGPGLIANDVKHRALPIYFSKPVTPLTYVAGKWLVIATFIAMVTLIPNLLSLIIGGLATGGLQTSGQMLNLGCDLFLSGLVTCLFAGGIIIALSSISSDSRYVTVGWLAVCLLPLFAQMILNDALPAESTTGWLGCISLRDNLLTVTEWLFQLRPSLEATSLPSDAFDNALVKPVRPFCAAVVLGGWTFLAFLVAYRRVVKFSRSAANV